MTTHDANVRRDGDDLLIDIEYPRSEGRVKRVTIELTDVRAADAITIEYDFDRDGWVVYSDVCAEIEGHPVLTIATGVEVAFIPAYRSVEMPNGGELVAAVYALNARAMEQ